MNAAILNAILVHLVIPEIANLLRQQPALTDAQLIALVGPRADRAIAAGEAWLAQKLAALPPTPPSP
jgi:hypothetical protein